MIFFRPQEHRDDFDLVRRNVAWGEPVSLRRPRAALAMTPDLPELLFGADYAARFAPTVELLGPLEDVTPGQWEQIEVLIGCWGAPELDADLLSRMPQLRGMVYAAGSVRGIMTSEAYERGVRISSGADANAVPVAEFTLAAILLAGKRAFAIDEEYRRTQQYRPASTAHERWGNFGTRVGIISASRIGRRVIELLAPFDVEVLVWDPTLQHDIDGATRVGLDELLSTSDVVSLHAPSLPETRGMLGERELALLPDGATLINTARGALIDQDALVRELNARRIHAVIDVTEPDVLPAGHPLFAAPNLTLTPHIAGSQGSELRRLGDAAFDELQRFTRGEAFRHDVSETQFALLA